MLYPVSEIFRSLQGEGHFVGYPTVFVRLAGCSVGQCHIRKECDEAPWKAKWTLRITDIVDAVHMKQKTGIVCLTGGEPTDHDLIPLVCALHEAGYRVHLETSGVRPVLGLPIEWITVSPKVLSGGELKQRVGHTLKIVIRPEWGMDEAWSIVKSFDACTDFFHRYLQPMTDSPAPSPDDGGELMVRRLGTNNLNQVIAMLLSDYNGGARWALSTQAHRTWGRP